MDLQVWASATHVRHDLPSGKSRNDEAKSKADSRNDIVESSLRMSAGFVIANFSKEAEAIEIHRI